MGKVEELWQGYASVYPGLSQDSVQYKELKRTFFAGCLAMFTHLVMLPGDAPEPTEADLSSMDALDAELRQWAITEMIDLGLH